MTPAQIPALTPQTYRPPVERICPACGCKHTGWMNTCDSCLRQKD